MKEFKSKKIINLFAAATILAAIAACNGGGGGSSSGGTPAPAPGPAPAPNTLSALQVSQTPLNLNKIGGHSTYTVTLTNPVSNPSVYIIGLASDGPNVGNVQAFSYAIPNTADPENCLNMFGLTVYGSVLQLNSGQTCHYNIVANWAFNNTSTTNYSFSLSYSIYSEALGQQYTVNYACQNGTYVPASACASNINSNSINYTLINTTKTTTLLSGSEQGTGMVWPGDSSVLNPIGNVLWQMTPSGSESIAAIQEFLNYESSSNNLTVAGVESYIISFNPGSIGTYFSTSFDGSQFYYNGGLMKNNQWLISPPSTGQGFGVQILGLDGNVYTTSAPNPGYNFLVNSSNTALTQLNINTKYLNYIDESGNLMATGNDGSLQCFKKTGPNSYVGPMQVNTNGFISPNPGYYIDFFSTAFGVYADAIKSTYIYQLPDGTQTNNFTAAHKIDLSTCILSEDDFYVSSQIGYNSYVPTGQINYSTKQYITLSNYNPPYLTYIAPISQAAVGN